MPDRVSRSSPSAPPPALMPLPPPSPVVRVHEDRRRSSPPPAASNWLPSADHPFGAKSQYRPTVTSIHHPELYEGRPATIDPLSVPLQHAAVSVPRTHVHNMARPRSSHHGRLPNATGMLLMRSAGATTNCDVLVADDPHEQGREHLHQLPVRSRSPQQQAEHVQLLVATRLAVEQFGQQRQLKHLLPSSRGRRRAVRTRHRRVCNIHATFHTSGRRRRTTDIANAPFWEFGSK